jgi:hypothetical protein
MRDFNEWELRKLQLELQQIDEDFTELNSYFRSKSFSFSKEFSDESTADMVSEDASFADCDDHSIRLLTSIDAADERNDDQMLIEKKFIII